MRRNKLRGSRILEKAYAILRASAVVLSAMLLAGCAGIYDTAGILDGNAADVITAGGSYDYSGDIKEPIVIEAPGQEVTINLNNARIEPAIGSRIWNKLLLCRNYLQAITINLLSRVYAIY